MMEMWWFIVGDGSLLEMAHCWRCGVCCWRCGGSLICSICGCGGSLRRRGGLFWRCGVSLGKCGAWLIDGDVMMSPGLGPVKDDILYFTEQLALNHSNQTNTWNILNLVLNRKGKNSSVNYLPKNY